MRSFPMASTSHEVDCKLIARIIIMHFSFPLTNKLKKGLLPVDDLFLFIIMAVFNYSDT